jgi:CRP-like cAMP-binding protein
MSAITLSELRQFPVFRGCSTEELQRLAGCMSRCHLGEPNTLLFEDQVESDAAYIVQRGTLVAELPLENGIAVEMARMGPGAVVGELCLIRGGPRSLRVKAMEGTDLIRIDREAFGNLRNAQDIAAYTVIRNICLTMCDRLRNTNEFIERELRHEAPLAADITSIQAESVAERARAYLSRLFGRDS